MSLRFEGEFHFNRWNKLSIIPSAKSLQIPFYNEVQGGAKKIYSDFLRTSRKIRKYIDLNNAASNSGLLCKT